MVGASVFMAALGMQLQGITPLELQALLAEARQPVVVNVWATWCRPCVEEFPELLTWAKENRHRARLVLISADFSSRRELVERFLRQRQVNFLTYLKEGTDEELIAVLNPQWSGALPATFVFAPGGRLVGFFERKIRKSDLDEVLAKASDAKKEGGKP